MYCRIFSNTSDSFRVMWPDFISKTGHKYHKIWSHLVNLHSIVLFFGADLGRSFEKGFEVFASHDREWPVFVQIPLDLFPVEFVQNLLTFAGTKSSYGPETPSRHLRRGKRPWVQCDQISVSVGFACGIWSPYHEVLAQDGCPSVCDFVYCFA